MRGTPGHAPLSAADIEAWAAASGADAADLLELLDRARIEYASFRDRFVELAGADRVQEAIGAAELAATRIAHYEAVIVPGILQTADYARELLHLPSRPARSGASEEEVSRMIASRLRRQAILYEPGRDITLLLGEGALRTRVAAPPTMHAQREHIARLAEAYQAIPQADSDGNPATVAAPGWQPLGATPNFPEYPSAQACHSTAVVEALDAFFGTDKISFAPDSRVTSATHTYDRLQDVVKDVDLARVLVGFHFRNSDQQGSTHSAVSAFNSTKTSASVRCVGKDRDGELEVHAPRRA